MSRYTAVSDRDYQHATGQRPDTRLTETPPAKSPEWWRAEYERIAELEKLLEKAHGD